MKPINQIYAFLNWFVLLGVKAFDVHVRKPKTLKENYKTGNWIWLTHNENKTARYIRNKMLSWIKYENANGSDIYFRPHKNSVHPVIFLDDIPIHNALKVAKKYTACVVETSLNNTQIWLATDKPLDKNNRKAAQILLKDKGYSDPGSISGDHFGRLCGVKSHKHGSWVNFIKATTVQPYSPVNEISKILISPPSQIKNNYIPKSINPNKHATYKKGGGACASLIYSHTCPNNSESEREWGWVLGMLRNDFDPTIITEKLIDSAIARGKKNPIKYAKRTVQKAILKIKK